MHTTPISPHLLNLPLIIYLKGSVTSNTVKLFHLTWVPKKIALFLLLTLNNTQHWILTADTGIRDLGPYEALWSRQGES